MGNSSTWALVTLLAFGLATFGICLAGTLPAMANNADGSSAELSRREININQKTKRQATANCDKSGRHFPYTGGACDQGYKLDKKGLCCRIRQKCFKGEGKGADGVCQNCRTNTYNDRDGYPICKPCRDCSYNKRVASAQCNSTRNTECGGCMPGYCEDPEYMGSQKNQNCIPCPETPVPTEQPTKTSPRQTISSKQTNSSLKNIRSVLIIHSTRDNPMVTQGSPTGHTGGVSLGLMLFLLVFVLLVMILLCFCLYRRIVHGDLKFCSMFRLKRPSNPCHSSVSTISDSTDEETTVMIHQGVVVGGVTERQPLMASNQTQESNENLLDSSTSGSVDSQQQQLGAGSMTTEPETLQVRSPMEHQEEMSGILIDNLVKAEPGTISSSLELPSLSASLTLGQISTVPKVTSVPSDMPVVSNLNNTDINWAVETVSQCPISARVSSSHVESEELQGPDVVPLSTPVKSSDVRDPVHLLQQVGLPPDGQRSLGSAEVRMPVQGLGSSQGAPEIGRISQEANPSGPTQCGYTIRNNQYEFPSIHTPIQEMQGQEVAVFKRHHGIRHPEPTARLFPEPETCKKRRQPLRRLLSFPETKEEKDAAKEKYQKHPQKGRIGVDNKIFEQDEPVLMGDVDPQARMDLSNGLQRGCDTDREIRLTDFGTRCGLEERKVRAISTKAWNVVDLLKDRKVSATHVVNVLRDMGCWEDAEILEKAIVRAKNKRRRVREVKPL